MKCSVKFLSCGIECLVPLLSPAPDQLSVGVMEWSCVALNRNSILPRLQAHGEVSL